MARQLTVRQEVWPLRGTFRISRGARTEQPVVVAEIREGEMLGRGECVPYPRYGESVEGVVAAIEALAGSVADGLDRAALLSALPAGAARNALDCALWDLEARQAGRPVWDLAGLAPPGPVTTAYTLGVDSPQAMGEAARAEAGRPLLKLKLTGDGRDIDRVAAIRASAPAARLVVDANEGWTPDSFAVQATALAGFGVAMIEQPLPAGEDSVLAELPHPVPVCADESCHDTATLAGLVGRYEMVNIKLDKTGGLTEALRLRRAALAAGFGIMVGCMVGTSLAMTPALLLAGEADVVDLDGPLLLACDRVPGLRYDGSVITIPDPAPWG